MLKISSMDFLPPLCQQFAHGIEHRIQVKRQSFDFKPAGFDPGEIKNVIDDAQQGIRGPLYLGEVTVLPGSSRVARQSSVMPMIAFIGVCGFHGSCWARKIRRVPSQLFAHKTFRLRC